MSKVFVDLGISLDSLIARSKGDVNNPLGDDGLKIHEWMVKQKVFLKHINFPGDGETGIDNDLVDNTFNRIGANIMGKKMFIEGEANWPENSPFHCPVYVLTHQKRERWEDPVTLWTNNVIESPFNKEAHKNLGIELMLKGRMREAFYSFTKSIELDSSYAEPYAHRAVILSEHASFHSAISDANRAIKLDSNRALYYNNRGYVYQFVKDYENAIKDFKKAISIDPKYDNVIKNLSVTYYYMGNYYEAMLLANRSIELDSTKEEYFNNRGNIYFAIGDLTHAEIDFKKALRIKPDYSKALNNIGVVKLKLQKIDEAIYYFTKTLEIDNRFIDSYYYRGYCSLLKGDKRNAYYDLTKCINLQKNHQGALTLLNQYFGAK